MAPNSEFLERQERLRRTGTARWRSADRERYYEWDSLHDEIEVYDKRSNHLGAANATSGELMKPPKKGRRISV